MKAIKKATEKSKPISGIKAGALAKKTNGLRFAPGCHSSPGLKAWDFLA
jgi:hypothetical protein